MDNDREMVVIQLELVAAKAKALAMELKNGKLWEGDLSNGLATIGAALEGARNTEYARRDRRN